MKNGSEALMVCVKETATLPRLMLVNTVPSMCPTASGAILPSCSSKSCTTNQQTKRRGETNEIAASLRTQSSRREWPHLRSGELGRRVEPGRPHEEDEQGAERELEGGDGVRPRQRQRAENLQWGDGDGPGWS